MSDVAQLDVVYQNGGFYLDTDVELIKPLDGLLGEKAYMGFERGRNVATGLGFGAEKGNPVIAGNLKKYEEISFVNPDGSLNQIACPVVTTQYLQTLGLEREDRMQEIEGIKIYPSDYFSPMLLENGGADVSENTISIHRYAGTWTTQRDRDGVKRRIRIYSRYGKTGLSIYDGLVLLRDKGMGAFLKRFREKFLLK